jgi:membrane protease YdiL (CAAX protease family)
MHQLRPVEWPATGQPALPQSRTAGWATLAAFFALAYALTWACWLPLAAAGPTDLPPSAETLATLGQFGPLLAALVVAGAAGGLRDLVRRFARWRVNPVWFGLALLLPPVLVLAAIVAHAVVTGLWLDVRWSAATHNLGPQFLYVLLLGGPLGEEPGWRGFGLPRLQILCRPLTATFLLALLWAGWHLPLWWVADVPSSFGFYVVGVIPLTYLFTWLTVRSGGSVPVALVFHASINLCLLRLPLADAFQAWTAMLWAAALVVFVLERGRPRESGPAPSSPTA